MLRGLTFPLHPSQQRFLQQPERPPFLLVVDVGNVIELYAEFSRSGATYTPFPDPRSHRPG